jgi:uncharacterized protein (DUF2062 family)
LRIVLIQSLGLMPRRLLKKICPSPDALQKRWYLRPFGDRIADPRLWTLHRRAVTSAFGVGLAICFIPLPVHLLVAGLIAIAWRINLPAIYGTTLLVNPVTCVPVYYIASRVGATLLGMAPLAPDGFQFRPSWEWFHTSLQPVWKPFLLGCVACAVVTGLLGWIILELVWRWRVTTKYRARHEASSAA